MTDATTPDARATAIEEAISAMELEHIVGQQFRGKTIYLDGRRFEGCDFTDCKLVTRIARFALVSNHLTRSPVVREGAAAAAEGIAHALRTQGAPPVQ